MNIADRARQPRGIPVGGQFANQLHAETAVSLSPVRNREAFAVRRELLKSAGYIPASTLAASSDPRTTAHRQDWWDQNFVAAEYTPGKGHPQMPDDYTPAKSLGRAMSGHRRTHRMNYGNKDIQLRMPSATSIKRFSQEHGNPTFDVPVSVTLKGGEARQGWVRVTKSGPHSWTATALAGNGDSAEQLSEAVAAVLESRTPSVALHRVSDLLEARKARKAAEGSELKPVNSSFIDAVGYDETTGTMATRIKGKLYGHAVNRDLFEAVRESSTPGATFNKLIKARGMGAGVDQCAKCGRFSSSAKVHTCPTGHKPASGIGDAHNDKAKAKATLIAAARSAGVAAPGAENVIQPAPVTTAPSPLAQPVPTTKTGLPGPRRTPAPVPAPEASDRIVPRPMPVETARQLMSELRTLRPGSPILVDGKQMYVQEFTPDQFGSPDERHVIKVGYGPGRFNRSLGVAALQNGYVDLRPVPETGAPAARAHLQNPIMNQAAYSQEVNRLQGSLRIHGFTLGTNEDERAAEVSLSTPGYTARISVDEDGGLHRSVDGRPVSAFDDRQPRARELDAWAKNNALRMARITDAEKRRRTQ